MESTSTKVEAMKPVLLKAGIPLAISVAGFIYANIVARRNSVSKSPSSKTQESCRESDTRGDFGDVDKFISCTPFVENETQVITNSELIIKSIESFDIQDEHGFGEEVLGLRRIIKDVREREWELERRFLRYHDLKEQESVLMELSHTLLLEMARVEFFEKEVLLVEEGNKKIENLVMEYVKVLEQLEIWKLENGVLHRNVKNLLRKTREGSRMIRAKNLEIEKKEAEIWRNCEELEKKNGVIIKLEDEVGKLQSSVHELQEVKNGMSKELELANASKIEAEWVVMEDYNKLANELKQLQTDRAAEVNELIFLRWSNACLRHELMRSQNQEEQNQERRKHLESKIEKNGEKDGLVLEQGGQSCLGIVASNQDCPRKGNLIHKFKRWVERSEKMKGKERHEVKCFGRYSVSDCAEEHLNARKSCSSASS